MPFQRRLCPDSRSGGRPGTGHDQNYAGNDVVLVIEKKTEHVHAIFGEVATTPAFPSDVRLAAGFRYNAPSRTERDGVECHGPLGHHTRSLRQGSVGTAFRLPSAEELFANDPNDERGNPDIKPEQSTNVNASVGCNFVMNAIHWEIVGFARDIKNLIGLADFDTVTNQDVFGNTPGTVRVRGGEFILNATLTSGLSGTFSYTHRDAKDAVHLQIRRVPENLVKGTVDYHPMGMPFGLFASINYFGDTFDTLGGIPQKYGDVAVFDIGGRVFLDMERHRRIDVNLQNVFDKQYATHFNARWVGRPIWCLISACHALCPSTTPIISSDLTTGVGRRGRSPETFVPPILTGNE